MLFRMITPRISKSRSIIHRKGIPEAVRAEYQRLYGQRWEAKLTLPTGMKPHEAKVRISEWTAEVESRIAAIRAAQRGEGRNVSGCAAVGAMALRLFGCPITQLRGKDIERRGRVHVIKLTPAAGTSKTGKTRVVPLHAHLIR